MEKIFFILSFFFCSSSAVIYQLNETEYIRMPPLFHLDPYERCILKKGGIYCTVEVDLVADDHNDLLQLIKEYSERTETHYNHTRLHHGICVTNLCKPYLDQNPEADLKLTIEKCLNDTFEKEYGLKTRINDDVLCSNKERDWFKKLETGDIIVAVICLSLIILNLCGTAYDLLFMKKENLEDSEHPYTVEIRFKEDPSCFCEPGVDQTVIHLVAQCPAFGGLRLEFECRALTIAFVIIEHSLLPFVMVPDNVHFFEKTYKQHLYHLLMDATVLVQTFFVISGCLLAYHIQMYGEKEKITWKLIPKGILLRWLRLTPSYAIVLIVTMTWFRFAGSGPLWHTLTDGDVENCRRYGWKNLLYINNYFDQVQCMGHTWYLAADMQLFVLGTFTLVLAKNRDIYRPILEWRGWVTPARISYSAYLLHLMVIQILSGSRTTLIHITVPQIVLICIGTALISYLAAFPFSLIVEAPLAQLVKLILPNGDKDEKKPDCESGNDISPHKENSKIVSIQTCF
ncbi:nose resistant to fluoxetine protein 6-like [Battus philenor]|uniref:nose resistant to fluoxetine protein 6-like n=1 Tax=Battus philenor TaxID=42288 RepID=UPI0035CFCE2A